MGSLMAGWDCNIPDPQVVKYKRNMPLTKEEIVAFWRCRKNREEDARDTNTSTLSPSRSQIQQSNDETAYGKSNATDEEEKLIKKHGWWVSSSLAHLNEPPVLTTEEATYKRVSIFKTG